MTLQEIVFALQRYWSERGCLIHQPWDAEVGAGTMHPETFLRVLGPKPWRVAYVQPSRRPGRRPLRREPEPPLQAPAVPGDPEAAAGRHPGPLPRQPRGARHRSRARTTCASRRTTGSRRRSGAWGIGWQVLLDGQEITQFTYFQQAGGIDLAPISAEITYGLERIAMYLQDVDDVYDLRVVERTCSTATCATRRSSSSRATRSSSPTWSCTAGSSRARWPRAARLLEIAGRPRRACRPTTGASRARTPSTCSTRAARSR